MKTKFNYSRLLIIMRGILALLFGMLTLFYPKITLFALAVSFGIFVLLGGIFLVIVALQNKRIISYWRFWFFEGILDLVIGLMILLNPEISVAVLLVIMGLWAIMGGIVLFMLFNKIRHQTQNSRGLMIVSILLLLFGIILLINPFRSAMAIAIIIGVFAIAYGVISIINAGKLKLSDF